MSISTQISRIQTDRNTIRAKLAELGLVASNATLDTCATAVENIVNKGAVNAQVKEGETYTIPAGYHNGSGVVAGVAGGGNYTLQEKSVTPTKTQQAITADSGYYGLSGVTVGAIPEAYQDVSATTAEAGNVLTGKVFVMADGTVTTGTMVNNGAVNKTLDASNVKYVITAGYHSGTGSVTITLEEKSVTPTKSEQVITPASGKVLRKVTVAPIPDEYQDVSGVTAGAGDVLDGKVIVNASGEEVEGTMVNNGTKTATLEAGGSYTIPAGYHNGSGKITAKNLESQTPGTATAAEILSNETAWVDGEEVTGAMPNNGAVTEVLDATSGNQSASIPAGYHNGSGKVSIVLETKNATPTKAAQNITPTAGKVLSNVTVAAIPAAYQDVTSVDAVAADVLDGKNIVASDGTKVEGAMPNNGATGGSIDGLTSTSVAIPAGYTTGGTVNLTSDIEDALAAI